MQKVQEEVLKHNRRNSRNNDSMILNNNDNGKDVVEGNMDNNDDDDEEVNLFPQRINPLRFSIKPNYNPITPRDVRRMSLSLQQNQSHAQK